MAIQEQQLAQVRNTTGGTAESAYSPGSGETTIVRSITICNNTASADTFSIYLDDDGTTYSEETCMFFDHAIPANSTIVLNVYWPMNNPSGNFAVEAATTDAVTFTVHGAVIT